jgi:hypothetical protein
MHCSRSTAGTFSRPLVVLAYSGERNAAATGSGRFSEVAPGGRISVGLLRDNEYRLAFPRVPFVADLKAGTDHAVSQFLSGEEVAL